MLTRHPVPSVVRMASAVATIASWAASDKALIASRLGTR
jgi:hypothetical protein